MTLAEHPERFANLKLYFDCGDQDRYGFDAGAKELDQILTSKGFPHQFVLRPGNHGWSYLDQYLHFSLEFHSASLPPSRGDTARERSEACRENLPVRHPVARITRGGKRSGEMRPPTRRRACSITSARTFNPANPCVVTDLYNRVFTQPDERQALNKLYNAFFRIPLFVANYQEKFKSPPSLAVIAEQFDLRSPADADVLLRVMESDPRVPPFLTRDPKTGEITHVDVERIKADPKFGQALERQIGGWEGKPAPDVTLARLGGGDLHLADFQGKVLLLEVWFTGCPPCMQEAPALESLDRDLSSRGLVIVGANDDRILGLDYDDSVRQRYLQEHHISYPIVNWTKRRRPGLWRHLDFPHPFPDRSKRRDQRPLDRVRPTRNSPQGPAWES